jgi:probable F420-dependent oxidoreductase
MRPFRFAVLLKNTFDADEWVGKARRIESLGYSTLVMPDHVTPHLASFPALTAAAMTTSRLRVSSFVMANDYRHPVLVAKDAASVDALSKGRFELALGTGWYPPDYEMLGMTLEPGANRVARLAEAVSLIKRLWTEEKVEHDGRWYRTHNATVLPRPVQQPHPPLLIGATSPAMLRLAGREADIVSINGAKSSADLATKLAVVREAAGSRYASIELNVTCDIAITDEPRSRYDEAAAAADTTVEAIMESPGHLYGSIDSLRTQLLDRRERYGLTYYAVTEAVMEGFAPLARDLAKLA